LTTFCCMYSSRWALVIRYRFPIRIAFSCPLLICSYIVVRVIRNIVATSSGVYTSSIILSQLLNVFISIYNYSWFDNTLFCLSLVYNFIYRLCLVYGVESNGITSRGAKYGHSRWRQAECWWGRMQCSRVLPTV